MLQFFSYPLPLFLDCPVHGGPVEEQGSLHRHTAVGVDRNLQGLSPAEFYPIGRKTVRKICHGEPSFALLRDILPFFSLTGTVLLWYSVLP
jgi:hypothetical protein